MGSGRSKSSRGSSSAVIGDANDVDGSERRRRPKSLFCGLQSSCLASSSASHDSDDDDEQVCNGWMRKSHGSRNVVESENQRDAADCYKELQLKQSENERRCNELELDDECDEESNVSNVPIRNGGESSSVSMNTPGRVFSHFKFIPGNISSRLSRASSSRSFNAYPVSSSGQRNEQEGASSPSESAVSFTGRRNEAPVIENVVRDIGGMRFGEDDTIRSPRVVVNGMDSTYGGILDRRHVIREHSERNVRFSRTLSVGRLRDRVLRRSSLSDFTFRPSPHTGEDSDLSYAETALVSGAEVNASSAADNTPVTSTSLLGRSTSSIRRTLFGTQDHETSTPLARYQGLLEHRSDFLERRRRIRSQVRALQRLGSRFETVTGHERSCVLAGQDQSGRCTCRASNRGSTTTTDETNARASISRIVLLAEALFEVLDEIHQQSVVLSSQPSVSSIGSVPAPNDVVESLPLKLYTTSHRDRNEDTSQCYICLVEYEEGDSIRTLPCNHEFHRACVDKWLKEIHRVCPLCRGDICRHEAAST